ncbi:MAG: ABC transporter substrate-binding protein [Lachnospiraceae bacterium]|jgi:peptide/nickel transport system substrate-binding protein|nr:ABC transporter substrate-binding protein [Lachnospiraceae bacterium]
MKRQMIAAIMCGVMVFSNVTPVLAENYKSSVKIATTGDLPSNAPYGNSNTQTSITTNSTFNGLVHVDREGNATPELATEWKANEDSTEWTFYLRENVKFHDGSDFTAEDVKFTWAYASSSENAGVKWPIIGADLIDEIVVEDDLTVTFKLNTCSPDWLMYAAQKIMSQQAVDTMGEAGCAIGTGPYKFEAQESGVSWSLERFDGYWGEPELTENITFQVVTDASTRALSLQSGDVDAIFEANASDIVKFQADSNYNVFQADNLANVYLGFNMDRLPGESPELRRAVAMAINRDDIVNACYEGGACAKPSYNIINEVSTGYAEVDYVEYDLDAARALLEENDLIGTTLVLYTFAKYIPVAEVVQADLSMVGINVEIREQSQSGFTGNLRDDRQYDMFINATSSTGGLLNIASRFFETGSTVSCMFYADPAFDELLDAARKCTSYDAMLDAYAGLQQHLAEQIPAIPLCETYLWCIGSSNFGGVNLGNQTYDVDFSGVYVTE